MSGIKFLKNFVKSPGTIGAVWPSSSYLAEMITSEISLEESSSIVELGPGTGIFTSYILKKKKPDSKFFVVELNKELYEAIKQKFPDVKIYNKNAVNLKALAAKEGMDGVDAIICGLPWAAFPGSLQDELLNAIVDVLKPGGCFTTFAYLQGLLLPAGKRFRKTLKKHFTSVKTSRTEWKNFPPAFVYRCRK